MHTVTRKFHFHAAHRNTALEQDKCFNIHGHTYHIEVTVNNPVTKESGTGMLFYEIEEKISPLINMLDHTFLIYDKDPFYEDLLKWGTRLFPFPFETSAENLCQYLYEKIVEAIDLEVIEVSLQETTSCKVTYRPNK